MDQLVKGSTQAVCDLLWIYYAIAPESSIVLGTGDETEELVVELSPSRIKIRELRLNDNWLEIVISSWTITVKKFKTFLIKQKVI